MLVVVFCFFLLLFFFKQKTAYEMRISDWSSDVCSSDLSWVLRSKGCDQATRIVLIIPPTWWSKTWQWSIQSPRLSATKAISTRSRGALARLDRKALANSTVDRAEIGRASCRERVCQYG